MEIVELLMVKKKKNLCLFLFCTCVDENDLFKAEEEETLSRPLVWTVF